MSTTASNPMVDENRLSRLLIQRKILTEGQLKAATDYQRSLGGTLSDVLVKLGLLRHQQVEEFLSGSDAHGEGVQAPPAGDDALAPEAVPIEDLIVHRKLLDKLPVELVEKYLLVLFFPVGNLSQRRVILGYGRDIPPPLPDKVKSVLGVQIYSLPLKPDVALSFLNETGRAHMKASGSEASDPGASGSQDAEVGPRGVSGTANPEGSAAAAREPSVPEPRAGESCRRSSAAGKGEGTALLGRPGGDTGLLAVGVSQTGTSQTGTSQTGTSQTGADQRGADQRGVGQGQAPAHSRAPAQGLTQPQLQSPPQAGGPAFPADLVLQALLSLLAKKGLATREELEVEIELARIRQRAGGALRAP